MGQLLFVSVLQNLNESLKNLRKPVNKIGRIYIYIKEQQRTLLT